jgi:hypothetical protein
MVIIVSYMKEKCSVVIEMNINNQWYIVYNHMDIVSCQ